MNRRTDPGAPTTEPPRRRTPPRPREGVPGKLRLNLQDLRVETFETTPGAVNAHGTVRALCD
ncbi:MAG TPA: hypothetical protein VF263_05430, partial [Longimicrobiaceae bacterium]